MSTEHTRLFSLNGSGRDDLNDDVPKSYDTQFGTKNTEKQNSSTSTSDENQGIRAFLQCQLVFILIVCLILITILVVIVILLHVPANYCYTKNCGLQAGKQEEIMNEKVTPCNDFYKYACGRWDKVNVPTPGVGKYSGFYIGQEKIQKRLYELLNSNNNWIKNDTSKSIKIAQDFFHGCMDLKTRNNVGSAPLKKLIKKVGGWSLISNSEWSPNTWNFFDTLLAIQKYGVHPFFTMESMSINPEDSSRHILTFYSTNQFLSRPEMLSIEKKYKTTFLKFGKTIAQLLGAQNMDHTNEILNEIWDLEVRLARMTMSPVDSRNPEKTSNKMRLDELGDDVLREHLDIVRFVRTRISDKLDKSTKVVVHDVKYMEGLGKLLATLSSKTKANYMVFKLVELYFSKLDDKFQKPLVVKQRLLTGIGITPPIWKACVALTEGLLPLPVSALYADKHWTAHENSSVSSMVEEIRQSLHQSIAESKWMDTKTKREAIKKVNRILISTGYPDVVFHITKLDRNFEGLQVDKMAYFDSYVNIKIFNDREKRRKFFHRVDRSEFSMAAVTTNAYYNQEQVTIKILAGILQYPFYDEKFSLAFRFGALGSVIGHEMTHGFDSRGRLYNSRGNLKHWWTQETSREYSKIEQCFSKQYSAQTFMGMHNNGKFTLAENIADNGGIQISYRAFKNHAVSQGFLKSKYLPGLKLNEDQIFFLSFAQQYCGHYNPTFAKHVMKTDVHSVYPHRVLVSLSNMKEFSTAFNCPVDAKYNPKHRCRLW